MTPRNPRRLRSQTWPCHALLVLLPACFHTKYLQDDAAIGPDDAAIGPDDAGVDAFASTQCPASYNVALPGPSRYRLITTGAQAWQASDTCAQDLPGATHVVVLETTAEVASVEALVEDPPAPIAANSVWVGGVQLRTATQPGEEWIGFDGLPLIAGRWYVASNDHEPNDGDATENRLEQFVSISAGKTGLNDSDGSGSKGALCECDGHPLAASAAAAVADNRTP